MSIIRILVQLKFQSGSRKEYTRVFTCKLDQRYIKLKQHTVIFIRELFVLITQKVTRIIHLKTKLGNTCSRDK